MSASANTAAAASTSASSLEGGGVVIYCDGPSCRRTNVRNMCSRCHRAFYCSVECQRKSWVQGGHKDACEDFDALLQSHMDPTFVPLPPEDAPCRGECNRGTLQYPIWLRCGHWICSDCAVRNYENRHYHCPECGAPVLTGDALPLGTIRTTQVINLKDPRLTMEEKITTVKRVLTAIERFTIEDSAVAHLKAEILLAANDAPSALEQALRSQDAHRVMLKEAAESTLVGEESRKINQIREFQEGWLTYQYVRLSALDPELGEIFLRASLCKADALFLLDRWNEALEVYQGMAESPEKAKAQRGIARCLLQLQQIAKAEAAAELALQVDHGGKTPGTHKILAEAQKAGGTLEQARQTMQRALIYEAPWNEDNNTANIEYLEELSEEQRAEEERRRREEMFVQVWGDTLALVQDQTSKGFVSWAAIKQSQYDMYDEREEQEDEQLRQDTANRLQSAVSAALRVEEDEVVLLDEDLQDDNLIIDRGGFKTYLETIPSLAFDRFKLTKEVRKWWEQGDNKYKDFFVRRLRQLAAGDRSRILRKRLTGSKKTTIFETYLEQKSGFRILWTESTDSKDNQSGIIIWYVSPHDLVSRYMRRIDEAETRTLRQLTTVSEVPDLMSAVVEADEEGDLNADTDLRHDKVMLDPFGDIPLKLYMLRYDDLNRMASSTWLPPLYLTTEERQIVETKGSILLLGRSGTGKTCCIANRIDHDRHLAEGDPTFSQLFVARSQRICKYVSDAIGSFGGLDDNSSNLTAFMTFHNFLKDCESRLPESPIRTEKSLKDSVEESKNESAEETAIESTGNSTENKRPLFDSTHHIDYAKFKAYFAGTGCELEPLSVWTQIRSFIKGSIESVMKKAPLAREEYLDPSVIGSRRCRLTTEQRDIAYSAFEKYEKYRKSRGLWDDCDRISFLVNKIVQDRSARELLARRRVYVDEIQDYTQAEIALFFLICDCGGLFLAGDPAQSVVEGVEFRFEEVRSVAYHLYPNDQRYIPKKPLTVTRNFRSHAGILNIAAEVLDKMFVAFPGSAKELPKDEGLFRGPRPTIFQGMNQTLLLDLVAKIQGVVLLSMHDAHVEQIEQIVEPGTVVLSIRDSKGLEFSDVIIVDFFRLLPTEQQKPWRLLLQGKVDEASQLPGFPEVENQLKQLYTAITRCSKRLFFVETTLSDSGQAFVRFLCGEKELALKQDVADVQEIIKTTDEWASMGVQYASNADAAESLERTVFWLDKALYCFQQAKDKELERKVQIHQESIQLRLENATRTRGSIVDEEKFEYDVAQQVKKLATEGLLVEARQFLYVTARFLNAFSRHALQERLIPLLPDLDEL